MGHHKNVIENFDGVPGRLEFVQKDPFSIIIDYAYPDSLEKVYQAVKKNISSRTKGKYFKVGSLSGGGSWKRLVMGEIALNIAMK